MDLLEERFVKYCMKINVESLYYRKNYKNNMKKNPKSFLKGIVLRNLLPPFFP